MRLEIHRNPHVFYQIMRKSKNLVFTGYLLKMVMLLLLPEKPYNNAPCVLCKHEYTDILCHIIAQCSALNKVRDKLWDFILDSVDIYRGVALSNMEDEKFVDIVCGMECFGLTSLL